MGFSGSTCLGQLWITHIPASSAATRTINTKYEYGAHAVIEAPTLSASFPRNARGCGANRMKISVNRKAPRNMNIIDPSPYRGVPDI
jgi:hypothetical protein